MDFKGLTESEVTERINKGKVNKSVKQTTKAVHKIIIDNLFNVFNIISLFLFILLIIFKSYKNTLFMIVITFNVVMGIVQELKAKRAIDRLKVITEANTVVIRNSVKKKIPVSGIVEDDVFIISPGDQITVDAIVLESDGFEADESLITGESDPVSKMKGDILISGSYAVSGTAVAKAVCVGEESYASKLSKIAKKYKGAESEILNSLNKMAKIICIFLVPLSAALFISTYFRSGVSFDSAVVTTAAAIIGMIPEGLILLTNISFVSGTIKLGAQKVLVQEPGSMETLARVDTVCLDKTGTLTEGTLKFAGIDVLNNNCDFEKELYSFVSAFKTKNSTLFAIAKKYENSDYGAYFCTEKIQFSSERKYSAAKFNEIGWLILGAYGFINIDTDMSDIIGKYEKEGYRVLLLAAAESIDSPASPHAIILLRDELRKNTISILNYLKSQDVSIRIISGDSIETVRNVTCKLEINGKALDCSKVSSDELLKIANEYSVFGRVTPEKKKTIIQALNSAGHVTAMIGDGANDIPALRESCCSIAMASGSDAVKGAAHIVLADSDIVHLPDIIAEGRRVINNIETVSSLFLIKTTVSILLSFIYAVLGLDFPYLPIHSTLVSAFSVGIPSFFLALFPNNSRVQKGFFRRVLRRALPPGLTAVLLILLIEVFLGCGIVSHKDSYLVSIMVMWFVTMFSLYKIILPLNRFKKILYLSVILMFFAALFILNSMLELYAPAFKSVIALLVLILSAPFVEKAFSVLTSRFISLS